jgi:hypothetical protein
MPWPSLGLSSAGGGSESTIDSAVEMNLSGAISVNSGAWTKVTFDIRAWIRGSDMEGDETNKRINILTTGLYLIIASASIQAHVTGGRAIGIYVNGSIVKDLAIFNAGANYGAKPHAVCLMELEEDDYVEVYVIHEAGLARQVTAEVTSTFFQAVRLA